MRPPKPLPDAVTKECGSTAILTTRVMANFREGAEASNQIKKKKEGMKGYLCELGFNSVSMINNEKKLNTKRAIGGKRRSAVSGEEEREAKTKTKKRIFQFLFKLVLFTRFLRFANSFWKVYLRMVNLRICIYTFFVVFLFRMSRWACFVHVCFSSLFQLVRAKKSAFCAYTHTCVGIYVRTVVLVPSKVSISFLAVHVFFFFVCFYFFAVLDLLILLLLFFSLFFFIL
ncbi:N(2), N(2)-dimethylguanosine tRNA methyltransferase, putative [Trypanosoma cruzi marinkellei]|uniref:N(2), N(2)-dimethylguanosine tRNA methyltransferase, putative n=1 Tax=Trypanosoma cruzi marinkellei TaxID=85056 RepID=K2NWA0_TRYCR|nr:N(2), N(2)-dimethylguanosine tRNA methyltransferase, putative [Trypanosoma cruzi marinkellei]